MPYFKYKTHVIEVKNDSRSGEETVFYDSEVVSSKTSLIGSTHEFEKIEDGEKAHYIVSMSRRGGTIVGLMFGQPLKTNLTRNGEQIKEIGS